MKRFKRVMCCLAAVMAVPMLFAAEPSISLTATPRYPWNGLVDLAFTIEGDEAESGYAVHQPGDDAIAGYRLKYVQSAGDAQLNTGVVPGSKNTIELKFAFDGTPESANQCLYCARGETTATASYTCFLLEGRWRFDYNLVSGTESATPTPVGGVPMVIRTVAGSATVDGIAVQLYTAANFTVGGPLTLFSSYVKTPGSTLNNYLKGKIYYLKIFGDDGMTLLHDFVPWEKDGVVGMYDMVAARFVAPNVGTLTCGTRGPKYDTSFSVQDVIGGTNLAMKTVYKSSGVKANVSLEKLVPGTYNWFWDAPVDLTSLRPMYSGCVPASSTVLFKNSRLDEIDEFHAVPCGTSVSDKFNTSTGGHIKGDGGGKSIQFAFSDDVYTKCVCMHFEQSGADVVGYAKWAKYVSGTGREGEDFDSNSATSQTIATSETAKGYGLCKIEARIPQRESSLVLDRVVIDANVGDAITYSVKFNANGGTGSMANETFESGVAKALTANAFTRMGYTFQGWATTSTGAVVYSDKQSVSNLSVTPNATVNLYAVWSDAVYMVIDLSGGASAKSYPVSYLSAVPSGGWSSGYKTTKLVLRKCKAGKYSMQKNRSVTLSKDFYIGVFELTQKQYKLITGNTPPENDGDSRPLANVSYDHIHGSSAMSIDSSTVIGKLKSKVGLNVNLPTEAQWEYACRAGTSSDTAINKYGRYSDNTNDGKGGYTGKTTVGSYLPNQWGIYDMRGNVWEWCLDGWVSDLGTKAVTDPVASSDNAYYPVLRGGGYNHGADYCTSYYRMYGIHNNGRYVPHGGNCGHGFRVCITMK